MMCSKIRELIVIILGELGSTESDGKLTKSVRKKETTQEWDIWVILGNSKK